MCITLAPYQDGMKPDPWSDHATWSLVDLLTTYLSGHVVKPWSLGSLYSATKGSTFRGLLIHSCAVYREVSHRELSVKIPSLQLVLQTALFLLLPKIHDRR